MTSGNAVTASRAGIPGNVQEQPGRTMRWRHSGGRYFAQDPELGMAAEVGRSGSAGWYVKVWPAGLAPCPDEYVRHETGLRTMADARAMALHMPCFRCGLSRPLIVMERYVVRWRCTARAACEAERARLTGRQS